MLAINNSIFNTFHIVDRKLLAHAGRIHIVQVDVLLDVAVQGQDRGLSHAGHRGQRHKADNIFI